MNDIKTWAIVKRYYDTEETEIEYLMKCTEKQVNGKIKWLNHKNVKNYTYEYCYCDDDTNLQYTYMPYVTFMSMEGDEQQ